MKVSQLLITVMLIACGILVYDATRGRPGPEPPPGTAPVREVVRTLPLLDSRAPIQLEGSGDELMWADLDRRLSSVERSLDGSTGPVPSLDPETVASDRVLPKGAGPDARDTAGGAEAPDEESGGDRISDAQRFLNAPPSSLEELGEFRKRMEWVERQRRIEKDARAILGWLDRQGVTLTHEQRLDVMRAALVYRARANRLPKASPDDERAQEERRANQAALRDSFVDSLYDMIPSAEADQIVRGMAEAAEAARKAKERAEAVRDD